MPLMSIAKRQNLSINYLEQVFSLLKKANIVKSVKGAQGGYVLGRRAEEITVADVIRAIEGDIIIVDEEVPSGEVSLLYQNMQRCLHEQVWRKITESVSQTMEQITLEELMKVYQEKAQDDTWMYYI